MIPKGLKVGETFNVGGSTYKVVEVIGENYSSIRVGETSPFAPIAEPKVEEDYNSMPYAQLKKICAKKRLDAKGSKEELIARLEG